MSMKLPIHGFVLAGGRSSRMGRDKALLPFCGRPMVEIAVTTLAAVCEHVSIAGNRDDLQEFAPVVHETRCDEGPVAGIEAGMRACDSAWALFMPVDLPLLPAAFIRAWGEAVLARPATRASYVSSGDDLHPALCLIHRGCATEVSKSIEAGKRSVRTVLEALEGLWVADAGMFADSASSERWLTNVNTPHELDRAKRS
jgi:molybdenum cofactor guanylyltransferase